MSLLQVNGQITLGVKVGSEEPDEYGMPQTSMRWGTPIPCMYRAVTDSKKGRYTDGHFKQSAFTVHIDSGEVNDDVYLKKRAKLTTVEGQNLGEFAVQSVTTLRLLGRIELSLGD